MADERSRLRAPRVTAISALLALVLAAASGACSKKSDPPPASPSDSPATGAPANTSPPTDIRQAAAQFSAARKKSPGTWTVIDAVAVLDRGPLGSWDENRVASPAVIRESDNHYRLWYLGCRLRMREHGCGVGHATSSDGVTWQKSPQPVFVPPDPVSQDNLEEISVVKANGRYYLWYSVAADITAGRRTSTIHFASSADGSAWSDHGQVIEEPFTKAFALEHTALHDGQRFHLWYVRRGETRRDSPLLVHLVSGDGKTWESAGNTELWTLQQDLSPIGRLAVQRTASGGYHAYFTRATAVQPARDKAIEELISADGSTWTMRPIEPDPFQYLLEGPYNVRSLATITDREGVWMWLTLIRVLPVREEKIIVAFRAGGSS